MKVYEEAYKKQIVREVIETKVPAHRIAKKYSLSSGLVYPWVDKYRDEVEREMHVPQQVNHDNVFTADLFNWMANQIVDLRRQVEQSYSMLEAQNKTQLNNNFWEVYKDYEKAH
jgi:transposase-like protein